MRRCLEHLEAQGIETCLIDNGSTDGTVGLAEEFRHRGVFRIETLPYPGYFDWAGMLTFKQRLACSIRADWFIHHDADEIREAPAPFRSLREGIETADATGCNAINFDEFVFLPTSDEENFEKADYVAEMKHYYFFEPYAVRRVNAWKNMGQSVDIVTTGGHNAEFEGRIVYPQLFVLRHYIVLSRGHAAAKYGKQRVYSADELRDRMWHGPRPRFEIERLRFPGKSSLKVAGATGLWDKSDPWRVHSFFGEP